MSHSHSHAPDRSTSKRALKIAVALTTTFMFAEVVGGLISGSLALLADAAHMLSDSASLFIALGAIWLAEKPATLRRSFGYQRAEILAALLNGVTLVVVSLWIFYEAYNRLQDPPEVLGGTVLVVAVVGLLVNLLAAWVLSRDQQESLNVSAALRHVLADLAGSVGVIVAALIIILTGWRAADPIIAALIGTLILASAWPVIRDSVRVLLEQAPAGIDVGEVEEAIRTTPGVVDLHDLHLWTITSGFPALAVHVLVEQESDCHERRRALEGILSERFELEHTTIQVDHAEPQLLQIEGVKQGEVTVAGDPGSKGRAELTFVFADIAGYTALTEAHGDRRAADVVEDFAGHLETLLEGRDGELVKTVGDAVMACFADPSEAVTAAHELAHHEMASPGHPSVGVGIHTGPAERRGADWFGASVNLASRIAALAGAGEVLVSEDVRERGQRIGSLSYEPLGSERLRNVREPVAIYRIDCGEEHPDRLVDPVCRMTLDRDERWRTSEHRGVEYSFCSTECLAAFARDPASAVASYEAGS